MAHVLLIEPDSLLARTYTQALQHAGHTVAHAHSAQEAINEADDKKPDVVVLELRMTVHDGVEFLQEFRSYSEWLHTPVIINSATPPAALRSVQYALEHDYGVTMCLYKPHTTLHQLLSAVNIQSNMP